MFYINTWLRYPPRKKSAVWVWGCDFLAPSTPVLGFALVPLVWSWCWAVVLGLVLVLVFSLALVLVVVGSPCLVSYVGGVI